MKIPTLLTGICLLISAANADVGKSAVDLYIAQALQGDLRVAHSIFSGRQSETLPAGSAELFRQYRSRFIDRDEELSPGTGDPLTDQVITAYRNYWNRSLTGEFSEHQASVQLEQALARILDSQQEAASRSAADDIYSSLTKILLDRGYHVLFADAPPLRDLILWSSEETRRFSVRLTDTTENVVVVFLSDIYSMGWKDYATFGLAFTTGWVEDGRLYCVDWAYDRSSEKFEVSFLKHESRHLADFRVFPDLQSADLEYRAKLTELAFSSKTTIQLLQDFTRKAAENPEAPHAYANYRVTREIYSRINGADMPDSTNPWKDPNTAAVNRVARSLLEADTRRLRSTRP